MAPQIPATGWDVALQHPETGRWARPDLLGDPEFRANPRGLPEAHIPVAQTPEWAREWDGAPMRVAEDGDEAPIDELDRVEVEQGRTVLVGVGGTELRAVVGTDIGIERTHEAAERLIDEHTTYTANVDTPEPADVLDTLVQNPSTEADFSALTDFGVTEPLALDTVGVTQLQTGFVNGEDTRIAEAGDDYVTGEASTLQSVGETSHTLTLTPDYTIPAEHAEIYMRGEQVDDGDSDLVIQPTLDGTFVGEDNVAPSPLDWRSFGDLGADGIDLVAGQTYELEFEATQFLNQTDADAIVDVIAVLDNRFAYTFDNTVHEPGGHLDGPELFSEQTTEFGDYEDPFFVAGGSVDVTTLNDTTLAAVALSNDRGETYPISASDTTTVSGTFPEDGATLRLRVTLEGQGETRNDATPRTGYEAQRIDAYELFADLDRTPGLIDYSEERRLVDILADIAGDEFLWEVARSDGVTSIEWAEPEQRVSETTPDLTDLTVQKDAERITKVSVKGANARISETFEASDSFVALDRQDIVPQTETVTPVDGDRTFARGEDYELRFRDGEIRLLNGSDMAVGETYRIDYQSEVRSTATADPNDGTAEVVDIPSASTERTAGQLARFLVDEFSVPRWRATARIPPQTGVFSAIDAITVGLADDLPDDAFPLSPRRVEETPEGLVVSLGREADFAAFSTDLAGRLRDVSGRT